MRERWAKHRCYTHVEVWEGETTSIHSRAEPRAEMQGKSCGVIPVQDAGPSIFAAQALSS